jgi:hypothetical protein
MIDQPRTLDARTYALGVLSITACVLLVGFLLVTGLSNPAHAANMNDRSGDYIMLTQQITTTTEAVIVVDAAAKKLISYGFDYNRKRLLPLARFDLEQLPKRPGERRAP